MKYYFENIVQHLELDQDLDINEVYTETDSGVSEMAFFQDCL